MVAVSITQDEEQRSVFPLFLTDDESSQRTGMNSRDFLFESLEIL